MGQTISRSLAGKFESGLQKARVQMEQNMRNQIKKNKHGFSDPNATVGFTRGMGDTPDHRDDMQADFQRKEQGNGNDTGEMPAVSGYFMSMLLLTQHMQYRLASSLVF
mmetsp:Transcript_31617/g.52186  ORF Transcript_31617/g.52186 Transcript_31617/m.52186 type:complete len:108 (-) Transcript_31617:271-594(-)